MRFILKISLVLGVALLMCSPVWAASFTASLDREAITLGESATLSLAFEGGQPQTAPSPNVPGLQIINVGNSQNFSIVNNQMSSVVTLTYSITPQRVGRFIIPAIAADVGGQHLSSPALRLTVEKPAPPSAAGINSGNEIAFMKLSLPTDKVYVGQTVVAQLQIYLRDDVVNYGQPQFSGTPMDGFVLGKNAGGGRSRAQVGNRVYTVIPISLAFTAVKSGPLTLGPFTANMAIVVNSPNQNNDPFRSFFNQGEQKQVTLTTDMLHVQGQPLPTEGRPGNFSGAVGDFTLNSSVGPTNVAAGDPVTIRVQISGHGSLDSITLPDQSALNGFKIFPPTAKTDVSGQLGLDGTKTFEEIVTPQSAEVHEWPQFSFSFFNPEEGRYHTLYQPAVPLIVKAVSATTLPPLVKNAPPENQTPRDILPIKQSPGVIEKASQPLIARPIFLAAQSVPVVAFLAALIWRRRTDSLANNPRLRRKLQVAQLVQDGLVDLKKFAAENKPDEFFALLFRLLQEQLGERLDCPATAITENVVEENSILRRAPDSMRDGLRELFQLCNQARYAPVRGTAELNSVAMHFGKVVGELQNLKT
ncbi:MAG TPA: BatD family protein [Verrucomicrobiae bacterium]|jgi:hypothetical protein